MAKDPRWQLKRDRFQWNYKKIGVAVRQLRELKGWTRERLAKEAGIGKAVIDRMESAGVDVRMSTLLALAQVFDVAVSELLMDVDREDHIYKEPDD